jgi:hypothetical protein
MRFQEPYLNDRIPKWCDEMYHRSEEAEHLDRWLYQADDAALGAFVAPSEIEGVVIPMRREWIPSYVEFNEAVTESYLYDRLYLLWWGRK